MKTLLILELFKRLWPHISQYRKKQFLLLFFLALISSIIEVISLGAVVPFLAVLASPNDLFEIKKVALFLEWLGFFEVDEVVTFVCISFAFLVIASSLIRLFLLWYTTKLSFAVGADLSLSIYRKSLYQPYEVQINRNSSEIITGITSKANSLIFYAIMPTLMLLISAILIVSIVIPLFLINAALASVVIGVLGVIYFMIIRVSRRRLQVNGQQISKQLNLVTKALQEGFGAIRDVLIDRSQELYCKIYQEADIPLRKAQGSNQFTIQSPRILVEMIGIVLIVGFSYWAVGSDNEKILSLPMLGAIAFAAQRLLPACQQSYAAWSAIRGGAYVIKDAVILLEQPLPNSFGESHPEFGVKFNKSIEFRNVSFAYVNGKEPVLKEINFTVKKGEKIGIVGRTGEGKSTLLDLVMGLIVPTSGEVYVDGMQINRDNCKDWQSNIAHVPQTIFLTDGTVRENIAFGVPQNAIDTERVMDCVHRSCLDAVVRTLPEGLETLVGERGVRLSGGQRQRIGIARALYKTSDVLVFDEATSALDDETESAIIESINRVDDQVTIFMVAHRKTTLESCDQIIVIESGQIIEICTYEELLAKELKC